MGRDSSKGKGRGAGGGRGGGKRMFIDNVEELAIRDRQVAEHLDARSKRRAGSDEESGDDDSSGDEENETDKSESVFSFEKTKAALPSANGDNETHSKGLNGGSSNVNPNHLKKPVEKMIKVKNMNDTVETADPDAGFNRKEREIIAAAKAKEDYQKRHMAGETEQARADLARLAVVKARREADAKKREAEGRKPGMSTQGIESSDDDSSDDDGKPKPKKVVAVVKTAAPIVPVTTAAAASAALAAKKKAAAAAEPEDVKEADGGPPKLKAMDIKKLNGDALKDHLKERGLDVQGQKKDLMKRLADYEAARA